MISFWFCLFTVSPSKNLFWEGGNEADIWSKKHITGNCNVDACAEVSLCIVMLPGQMQLEVNSFLMCCKTQAGLGLGAHHGAECVTWSTSTRAAEVFWLYNLQNWNCRQWIKKQKYRLREMSRGALCHHLSWTTFTVEYNGSETDEPQLC